MDVAIASRFFALLALSALLLAGAGLTRLVSGRPRVPAAALDTGALLGSAWVVAFTSTLGSLYYSEVAGFTPCTLCWYQRIAMYPLVLVLGVATLRRDPDAWRYGLPLAGVGLALSSYHYLVQHVPDLGPQSCSATVPCSAAYVWEFGFVSIPFMAGAGFLAIVVLLVSVRKDAP